MSVESFTVHIPGTGCTCCTPGSCNCNVFTTNFETTGSVFVTFGTCRHLASHAVTVASCALSGNTYQLDWATDWALPTYAHGASNTYPANFHTGALHGWLFQGAGPGQYDKIIVWFPNKVNNVSGHNFCVSVTTWLFGKGQDNTPTLLHGCTNKIAYPQYPAGSPTRSPTSGGNLLQTIPDLIPGTDCVPNMTTWTSTGYDAFVGYQPGPFPAATRCLAIGNFGGAAGIVECSSAFFFANVALADPPCADNPCDYTDCDITVFN